ncbi:MAG: tryptophan-rich sensory protein [Clostridia bacterium]|nr:tryptophan-rich sensory protein [Clostridia bacterium]
MKKENTRLLSIVNLIAYLLTITINILAQFGIIGGRTTSEISKMYPTLFTPAGITFAIWGLIYSALGIYSVLQLFKTSDRVVRKVGWPFLVSCLLNIAWTFAWQNDCILLSLIILLMLWASLWLIDQRVKNEGTFVRSTFAVYYAWITVATIANAFVLAAKINPDEYDSVTSQFFVMLALALVTILAVTRNMKDKNTSYAITMAWAVAGVLITHISSNGYDGRYPAVVFVGIIAEIVIDISTIVSFSLNNEKKEISNN